MRPKGPVKRMNVVMVPCSDSKRSSSGISVKRLRRRWKTDLCMSGKVFSLYTVGKTCQHAAEWDGRRRRRAGHTCAQINQVWDQGAPYGQQRIEEVHEIEHDDDE